MLHNSLFAFLFCNTNESESESESESLHTILKQNINSFLIGKKGKDWISVDKAVELGHKPLIQKFGFCTIHGVNKAAKKGNLTLLQWIYFTYNVQCNQYGFQFSILNKHFHVTNWLLEINPSLLNNNAIPETIYSLVATGNFPLIQKIPFSLINHEMLNVCAEHGYLNILQWYFNKNKRFKCTLNGANKAALNGHLNVLLWLEKYQNIICTVKGINNAALNGHLNVIKWLWYTHKLKCTIEGINNAGGNGHVHVLVWIWGTWNVTCNYFGANLAAANNHLNVLQSIYPRACTGYGLIKTIENGHLKILQWIYQVQREETFKLISLKYAIEYGQLSIIQWLLTTVRIQSSPNDLQLASKKAAKKGHLSSLKWLFTHNYININETTLKAAINGNQLDIVHWHLQNGILLETYDLFFANIIASKGYLEVLQFCNLQCSKDGLYNAIIYGHLNVVQYLMCTQKISITIVPNDAIYEDNIEVIHYLLNQKVRFHSNAANCAVKLGLLEIVNMFYDYGITCTENVMNHEAVVSGYVDILEWLQKKNYKLTPEAMDNACRLGKCEIIQWLKKNNVQYSTLQKKLLLEKNLISYFSNYYNY